jgi:phosphoribosyl 1,2-cyclic phosphodiesterase/anti-anti-sigma regulatory factor
MKLKVWGARGSIPTPLDPKEIEEKICQAIYGMAGIDTGDIAAVRAYVAKLPPLLRGTAGGNTACVEVRAHDQTSFIIDAGSGVRRLGLELMKGPCGRGQGTLYFFFSHPHWDHIQGFPFFAPAYVPGNRIVIYSLHDLQQVLTDQQRFLNFPVPLSLMRADLEFIQLEPGIPLTIPFSPSWRGGWMTINTICNNHPGDAFGYRFEDQHSVFVYASDAEYKRLDEAGLQLHLDFFRGADALVFDAQYGLRESWEDKADWGHSSAMIGVDLARQAGVKRLLLFHHEPTYADDQLQDVQDKAVEYQAQAAGLPPYEVMIAYEGLELDLTPAGAIDVQWMAEPETAVLIPSTVFDEQGVDQLSRHLTTLTHQDAAIGSILDLSQVERLTTASLKALVTLSRQGPLVLAAPSPAVAQVIKWAGYRDYFAIYPTVAEAIKAVQAREALNLPGQIIDEQYQIIEKLGEGRLGTVLKVTDLHQERTAALRILSPTFGVETIDHFAGQLHRLLDLDHHHLAQVYDCDWSQDGNYTFIVEELLDGPTLSHWLATRADPLTLDEALDITLDLALALEYAHSQGVIHGNLKPQDIFLTGAGLKIRGFGLGHLEEGRNLLEAPMLFLTASHLAPEQILGQPLDPRTDLYALGVISYQLFTGRLPFIGSEPEILQAHLEQEPLPPRALNPQLSYPVEHLILKLLAKNPHNRYASAQQARRICNSLIFGGGDTGGGDTGRVLVGRDSQLQALRACWTQARSGQGQLAFITGQPGIGKTSLAHQLASPLFLSPVAAADASSEVLPTPGVAAEVLPTPGVAALGVGGVVLTGHCQASPIRPAYHPFRQALHAYFATMPPDFFDAEARRLMSNFIPLVPELRQIVLDLPEPPPLDPQQEQLRLVTSLAQFIERTTQLHPWLLILDDLQWIDASSLDLLRHLAHHLPACALFIVGTYRDTEVGHDHPLHNLPHHHIPLGPLDQADVLLILHHLWGVLAPKSLVEKIHQQTAGNPLYVKEIARGLEEAKQITFQDGQWHFPSPETIRLPQSLPEAIEGRIHYLSADTRDVLAQAAVLGQTFLFTDLVSMSSLSEWVVLEHLDLALERQLVQEVAGDDTLRFRHPEIHHVIYHDLGPLRRRRLHRRAGEALEQRAPFNQPASSALVAGGVGEAGRLARHFTEAGESEKALLYSLQAGRQAQSAYANEIALQWYNQALLILDQLASENLPSLEAQRGPLQASIGEVLALLGPYDSEPGP